MTDLKVVVQVLQFRDRPFDFLERYWYLSSSQAVLGFVNRTREFLFRNVKAKIFFFFCKKTNASFLVAYFSTVE